MQNWGPGLCWRKQRPVTPISLANGADRNVWEGGCQEKIKFSATFFPLVRLLCNPRTRKAEPEPGKEGCPGVGLAACMHPGAALCWTYAECCAPPSPIKWERPCRQTFKHWIAQDQPLDDPFLQLISSFETCLEWLPNCMLRWLPLLSSSVTSC